MCLQHAQAEELVCFVGYRDLFSVYVKNRLIVGITCLYAQSVERKNKTKLGELPAGEILVVKRGIVRALEYRGCNTRKTSLILS